MTSGLIRKSTSVGPWLEKSAWRFDSGAKADVDGSSWDTYSGAVIVTVGESVSMSTELVATAVLFR